MEGDNSDDAPKKVVALKVPSIFIKGSSSSSSVKPLSHGDGETPPKVGGRPMPASVRKKLEKAKEEGMDSREEIGIIKSELSNDDGKNVARKIKRPMPASARRKLNESAENTEKVPDYTVTETTLPASPDEDRHPDNIANDDDNKNKSELSASKSVSKLLAIKKKPMPASARQKQEEENKKIASKKSPSKTNSENVSYSGEKKSLFQKRKLEKTENNGECTQINAADPDKTISDFTLEIKNTEKVKDDHQIATESMDEKANENETGDTGSDKTRSNSDSNEPASKITISLDGIRFPTFKKPMPASVKYKKVEEKQIIPVPDANETEKKFSDLEENTPNRRSRRSSNVALESIRDETFTCEYCGREFYSLGDKNRHEQTAHLEVKTKPPRPKENRLCPHCNKFIKRNLKFKQHVSKCAIPYKYSCHYCDKKFKYGGKKFEQHENSHLKLKPEDVTREETAEPLTTRHTRAKSNANNDSLVPSPMSATSPADENPKSSMSSDEEADQSFQSCNSETLEGEDTTVKSKSEGRGGARSFKRKIADVLSNLGSMLEKSRQECMNKSQICEEDEPPRKKAFIKEEGDNKSENARSRPMPASMKKKKLEKAKAPSSSKIQTTSVSGKSKSVLASSKKSKLLSSNVHCEVCFYKFSTMANRKRHEKHVHKIAKPRDFPQVSKPTEKCSNKASTLKPNAQSNVSKPAKLSDTSFQIMDFHVPSKKGDCPVCGKHVVRPRKHLRNVHKVILASSTATTSLSTTPVKVSRVRPSAPKSYKIYKRAAAKIKMRFTSQTSKSASSALEKIKSKAEPKAEPKAEKKSVKTDAVKQTFLHNLSCCNQAFEVQGGFASHMEMRHPKVKVIRCIHCRHLFSHEVDFIIHLRFHHENLVISGQKQDESEVKTGPASMQTPKTSHQDTPSGSKQLKSKHIFSTRSLRSVRKVGLEDHSEYVAVCQKALDQFVSVSIPFEERQIAECAVTMIKETTNFQRESRRSKSTRSTRARTPSPEPMDTFDEPDDYDDLIEVDTDPVADIAITSTFSQKVPSPKKNPLGLDEMPCSTCTEVFYSFEALRKHELYFHNVKTSKMCPICGVYPTKLSRHLLAHENKTVRCSCAPCHLNFPEFGQLLKHTLEFHPGPDGGGLSAPNKPKTPVVAVAAENSPVGEIVDKTGFTCKVCYKIFGTRLGAKKHIRSMHPENAKDMESYIENPVETKPNEDDFKVSRLRNQQKEDSVREKTRKQNMNPVVCLEVLSKSVLNSKKPNGSSMRSESFESVSDKVQMSETKSKSKPIRPMPASVRAKQQAINNMNIEKEEESVPERAKEKPKRSMPASVKAKFAESTMSSTDVESRDENKAKPSRPMPASARAKMLIKQKSEENTGSDTDSRKSAKLNRSMPASVRAKLLNQQNDSSNDSSCKSSATPNRAMPASVRAKLMTKAERKEVPEVVENGNDDIESVHETPDHHDSDNDDGPASDIDRDDNSVQEVSIEDTNAYLPTEDPIVEAETSMGIPTFSIADGLVVHNQSMADEIAEHNRALKMVMDVPSDSNNCSITVGYQCKLCSKKFDMYEDVRRHIRKAHYEYGPEHTDNLIEQIYEAVPTSGRSCRANAPKYTDDDDDEEEIIRPRGTTRRPRSTGSWGQSPVIKPPESRNSKNRDDVELNFACKFCGKKMDSSANVKRHASKAHRGLTSNYANAVVTLLPGEDYEDIDTLTSSSWTFSSRPSSSRPMSSVSESRGELNFHCRFCYKQMDNRKTLRWHIFRAHPEMSDRVDEGILELVSGDAENAGSMIEEDPGFQDEPEIDMTDVPKWKTSISVTAAPPLHTISETVSRSQTSEVTSSSNSMSRPGPATRKVRMNSTEKPVEPVEEPPVAETNDNEDFVEVEDEGDNEDNMETTQADFTSDVEEPPKKVKNTGPVGFTYQADLSSLFPSLSNAGGLDAIEDIGGGMELD